jgi:hypothetical protein
MLILNNAKKKEITLISITLKDKKNDEHKKANEIISKHSTKY